MNILAYIIYLLITYFVTVQVGLIFYQNGRIYILHVLAGDEKLTEFINRILLTGYYLLNLGYAAMMISFWKTINTYTELVGTICTMTGRILLTLATIHFLNMTVIYIISRQRNSIHHHNN